MKKRILSLLMAICMIASLLPTTAFAAAGWDDPWIYIAGNKVEPVEGGDAYYFDTDASGNVTVGDADGWQVKVWYPQDGVPTVELDGAYIVHGSQPGIGIGYAGYFSFDDYPVDIKVLSDSEIYVSTAHKSTIESYATMDLTIKSDNGSRLYMRNYFDGGTQHAAIRSEGNIKLEGVELAIASEASKDCAKYIYSLNGDITIDNAKVNIVTAASRDEDTEFNPLIDAPNGKITIQNGANVAVWNKRNQPLFNAGTGEDQGMVISGSTVKVAATAASGAVFSSTTQPTLTYAKGYEAAAAATASNPSGTAKDGLTIIGEGEYNAEDFASYKFFSVEPKVIKAFFGFEKLEVTVTEGQTEYVYANQRDASFSDEANANVVISYPVDGKPTITLKGGNVYGNGYALQIGKDGDTYDVDVVVEAYTMLWHNNDAGRAIDSKTSGTLTITGDDRLYIQDYKRAGGNNDIAAIRSYGDIVLKDANVYILGDASTENGKYILSFNGNITVDGGKLSVYTQVNTGATLNQPLIHAPAGKITIENGAKVSIYSRRAETCFVAANGIFLNESTVRVGVAQAGGAVFGSTPVLGYAGYTASMHTTPSSVSNTGVAEDLHVSTPDGAATYDPASATTCRFFAIAPAAHEHNYVAGEVVESTCAVAGYTVMSCTCGKSYNEPLSLAPHADENKDYVCDSCGAEINYEVFVGFEKLEVTISRGQTEYVLAEGRTASKSDAANANVVISFPEGGKPTITLKGGSIGGNGYAIQIGKDGDAYNVDVVVEAETKFSHNSDAGRAIDSKISGTLTITGEGRLFADVYKRAGDNNDIATIRSVGDIKLENAHVDMRGCASSERGKYILSFNGDVIIDGGKLVIVTYTNAEATADQHLIHAPMGEITIQNGADVKIWNRRQEICFVAAEGITINESSVAVAVSQAGGTVFGSEPALDFAEYSALMYTAPSSVEDLGANGILIHSPDGATTYDPSGATTCRYFSVAPAEHECNYVAGEVVPSTCAEAGYTVMSCTCGKSYKEFLPLAPHTDENNDYVCDVCENEIVFEVFVGFETLEVTISRGGTKYILASGRTAAESDEENANVVISFPEDGKPTITLKGGAIGGNGYAILIGRDGDYYPVDIVVEAETKLSHNADPGRAIDSKTSGTLTIKGEPRLIMDVYKRAGDNNDIATIRSYGDIKFEGANVSFYGNAGTESGKYILSFNGDIIINGGEMKIMTNTNASDTYDQPLVHAPNGEIIIENGADVIILNQRKQAALKAGNGIAISGSKVEIGATAGGSVFGSPVTVDQLGYITKATATVPTGSIGPDYTVSVATPAGTSSFVADNWADYKYFAISKLTAEFWIGDGDDAIRLSEGDAPVYLNWYLDEEAGVVKEAGTEELYTIMVSFNAGEKPTITLNGAFVSGGTYPIVAGAEGDEYDVIINVIGDSHVAQGNNNGVAIKSLTSGNLIIKGESKLLLEAYKKDGTSVSGTLQAKGNINLEGANVMIYGNRESDETGMHILSETGSISVVGGKLQIGTGGAWDGDEGQYPVMNALVGKIIIRDGADVAILNQRATSTFKAAEGIYIADSTVNVAVTNEGGSIFASEVTFNYQNAEYEYKASETAPDASVTEDITVSIGAMAGEIEDFDASKDTYKHIYFAIPEEHECADDDTDHDCDICGAEMGVHAAAEGSHDCDYCQKRVSECNEDGVVEPVAATCTTTGKVGGNYCNVCNAGYEDAIAETPVVDHSFTAEVATSQYLKTKATINTKAVYYTSCAVCGESSKGYAGEATFEGDILRNFVATVTFEGVSTNYLTLAQAVEEAVDGAVITLNKNSVGAGFTISADVTIDFGEYYYSVSENEDETVAVVITGDVTFTGIGGGLYVVLANRDNVNNLILNKGTLTTTGNVVLCGQYMYHASNESWVVVNEDGASATFNEGTQIVTSWKGVSSAIKGDNFTVYSEDITIPKGYCANAEGVWNEHKFIEKIAPEYLKTKATINSKAVYYKSCEHCGLSSKGIDEDAIFYGDIMRNFVATVTFEGVSTNYLTLAEAVEEAVDGAVITLNKNSVGVGFTISADITIDFGEYYYSVYENEDETVAVVIAGNVTFTGNGGGLYIRLTNRDNVNTLIRNEGTLKTEGNVVLCGQYMYHASNESWVVYNVGEATADIASATVQTSFKGVSHVTNS